MTPSQLHSHALGVLTDSRQDSMEELLRIDKERLVERHATEIADLQDRISGLKSHASELGNVIRRLRKREDRFWLAIAGMAMMTLYFMARDLSCK